MSISRKIKLDVNLAHRSSFHSFYHPNLNKVSNYSRLFTEVTSYHNEVFSSLFDQLKFDGTDKSSSMIAYKQLPTKSGLTGSFKSAVCTQVADELSGIIKNFNYWFNRCQKTPTEKNFLKLELAKTKPEFSNLELRFCFADLEINQKLCYLQINGCGKYGIGHKSQDKMANGVMMTRNKLILRLPFKFPKYHRNLLGLGWSISTSVTLCKDGFRVNYEKEIPANDSNLVVGVDQGINNCLSMARSDGSTFQSKSADVHGHSLNSIQLRLCRKKKGSKAYCRGQEHRKNFINARINEAKDFLSKASVINLEDLRFIGKGQKAGRFLSSFEHSRIRFKLGQICSEEGLSLNLSANAFKSRRCNQCGWVDKANRSGRLFKCTSCEFEDNADLNAAKNHLVDLPKLYPGAGNLFYWQRSGASLVPDARKFGDRYET